MGLLNTNKAISLLTGVANLGNGPLTIEMQEGTGWITHNDEDIVVKPRTQIELAASDYPILISAPCNQPGIVFRIL